MSFVTPSSRLFPGFSGIGTIDSLMLLNPAYAVIRLLSVRRFGMEMGACALNTSVEVLVKIIDLILGISNDLGRPTRVDYMSGFQPSVFLGQHT
jgi:hypothetical protein